MKPYWERVALSRLSRRRALTAAAGAGLGAAALAAVGCGSGGEGGGSQTKSKLAEPVDSTGQAKSGGIVKSFYGSANPASLDPHTSQGFTTLTAVAVYTYPRLLRFNAAKYPNFTDGTVDGDLAESYELSGDRLQVTLKLRKGLKWENRSPTNGREIDAEDVLWNWKKFSEVGVRRGDLAYSAANPSAPVESMTAPDKYTIVAKLHEPDASTLQLLASARIFFVIPREAEDKFDPRNEVRGYGPFFLKQYEPSSVFVWQKNPDYWMKNRPFFDGIEQPHVVEYAARLAQFKAGNIWPSIGIRQEDVLSVYREIPHVTITADDEYTATPGHISFGYEGDSPFRDVRVRRAIGLAIDREAMADTISNRPPLKAEGFEMPSRYQTLLGAGWGEYWLDPQDGKKFGPNARYWSEFNPADAKKLLEAAGHAHISTELNWVTRQYGATYEQTVSIIQGMLQEVGIDGKSTPREYQTDYIPNIYYSYTGDSTKGYNGMIYRLELAYPTAIAQLFGNYHPGGGRYRGVYAEGSTAKKGDPKLNSMIEAARREFDSRKQIDMVHDILRYAAGEAISIPPVPTTLGLILYWPVLRNYGLYRTQTGSSPTNESVVPYWWIDSTKAPLNKPA